MNAKIEKIDSRSRDAVLIKNSVAICQMVILQVDFALSNRVASSVGGNDEELRDVIEVLIDQTESFRCRESQLEFVL